MAKTLRTFRLRLSLEDSLKSDSLWGPREIDEMWRKVGKMDPLIFRPETTYGMLRIVI